MTPPAVHLPINAIALLLLSVASAAIGVRTAGATEFHASFDDAQTSWQVRYNHNLVRLVGHQRDLEAPQQGKAAERIEVQTRAANAVVQLTHDLPAARLLSGEVKVSLWVNSNRQAVQVALQVVCPQQLDPRTKKPLTMLLRGDVYNTPGQWQQLHCTALPKQIDEQLKLLRYQLRDPQLHSDGMYVDRVILGVPLASGSTVVSIDELRFGPIVPPQEQIQIPDPADDGEGGGPPVALELDRLFVEGRPFFPRMLPDHGEDVEDFKAAHANTLWLSNVEDQQRGWELRRHGLWAAATPPRAVTAQGRVLAPDSAGMLPFSPRTAPLLFWYMGTQIPGESKAELLAWIEQVRAADRKYARPLMADVAADERFYSRHLSMLGVSRHVINTSLSLQDYRDYLLQARRESRPGSFTWTWIQTEAATVNAESRRAAGFTPIVVEPEQIRLQTYAAISAGCRGIGYWKTQKWRPGDPAHAEARAAVGILNLELELLEPWLATGTVVAHVPFTAVEPDAAAIHRGRLDFRGAQDDQQQREALLGAHYDQVHQRPSPVQFEAAVIRSSHGTLVLPVWYEPEAQFVPGQLVAQNVEIVVRGAEESASAWVLSTTDAPRSVRSEQVPGGLRIKLDRLDQTAMIVLSPDRTLRSKLQEKIERIRAESAEHWLKLARLKSARVGAVDQEMESLGVAQPDAPQLRARAEQSVEAAQRAFDDGNFDECRQRSAQAMQALRILQRAHWNNAIRHMSSPVSSPHTLCFQTLPDHWRMIARLGTATIHSDQNLLRSGDFEDIEAMLARGWRHTQQPRPGIRASAELLGSAREGKYCLRLVAVPETGTDLPLSIDTPPVSVTSPEVTVHAGQILHISGWIRMAADTVGSLDGVMIYDSLGGVPGALRWTHRGGWQRFQVAREVHQSGPLSLTIALNGIGDVQIDDLKIIPHEPRREPAHHDPAIQQAGGDQNPKKPWDIFDRIPRWNPFAPPREGQ